MSVPVRSSTGDPLGGSDGRPVLTFPQLARDVIVEVAPGELEPLAEVTQRWLSGRTVKAGSGGWLGGSIGSGLTPDLVSTVIYPILTGAFAPLLGSAMTGFWRRLRRRIVRRGRRRHPVPSRVPPLRPDQLEAVRDAILDSALRTGMSRKKAEAISDAAYGSLVRSLQRAADRP